MRGGAIGDFDVIPPALPNHCHDWRLRVSLTRLRHRVFRLDGELHRSGERLNRHEGRSGTAIGALASLLAGLSALATGVVVAAPPLKQVPLPRPRPHITASRNITVPPPAAGAAAVATPSSPAVPAADFHTASLPPAAEPVPHGEGPVAYAPTASTSEADLVSVKQAIELARRGKSKDATEVQSRIDDPLARKLVEWAILHSDDNSADFARFRAFIAANPSWPSLLMFRRRAEAMLWQERADLAAIRAFTGNNPISAKGRLALGRALLASGDQAGALAAVRETWQTEPLSRDLEEQALEIFGGLLTRGDDKARMDVRLYANDNEAGLRAAHRLGGNEPEIAKAHIAVHEKSSTAKALLDALPAGAKSDPLALASRIELLIRNDKIAEALEEMMAAPHEAAQVHDTDEWWVLRRRLARKLLDAGNPAGAYKVARDAAPPVKENWRIEHQFTAGWIALRYLNDPALAAQHFARIGGGVTNPISLARAFYWRGRAADAMNRTQEAHSHYEQAARFSTAYYGQLARAKLGLAEIAVATPPRPSQAAARIEVARAVELLYAAGERDLIIGIVADLGDRAEDVGTLAAVAEIATRYEDARSVLLIGKGALARGYPLDHYAFPTFGLPRYSAIGPEVEPAVVYAIARQESAFNPRDVSSAHALGLMQVTPDAGRYIAKKFNVPYDQNRLLNDKVYNMQIGAAELGDDIAAYNGSYILAFAGYNAGRGRVKEWVATFGDPRDPKVDPIDWVERIPFAETRNYVQRILENIQVYRTRFGGGTRLLIEADMRRGANAN
jgi:soluble lytic murein transglycosylase